MGTSGKKGFDLNEAPMDASEEFDDTGGVPSRKARPAISGSSFGTSKPSTSVFQPLGKNKRTQRSENNGKLKKEEDRESGQAIIKVSSKLMPTVSPRTVVRQEGEWSDAVSGSISSRNAVQFSGSSKSLEEQGFGGPKDKSASAVPVGKSSCAISVKELARNDSNISADSGGSGACNITDKSEATIYVDGQRDPELFPKKYEVKGVEASYGQKCANSLGKKHKLDEKKEAMLGKKRIRQTMFLNLEGVKQAGAVKSSNPKRQTIPPPSSRIMRGSRVVPSPVEINGEKQNDTKSKDGNDVEINEEKQNDTKSKDKNDVNLSLKEDCISIEPSHCISECNTDKNAGLITRSRGLNSSSDLSMEVSSGSKQILLKQPAEISQEKDIQVSFKKPSLVRQGSGGSHMGISKKNPPKKPIGIIGYSSSSSSSSQYQDTSVERLLREVTSEKFWHTPEATELQCVPGQFESVEEYVGVFEPLLFEECRAQLFSTWEELTEASSRDVQPVVRVKYVERRERGWFDVIVMPENGTRLTFKEGDVAILSSSKPTSVRSRRNMNSSAEEENETEATGRVMGTIRRHIPIDTRDPLGATLHFYVGDSYDSYSGTDNDHIARKLQPNDVWFLTVLGSLATTQREYVGLHAFCRLNWQMQCAILRPSAEHFPKYEEQTPTIPQCFTPKFVQHLHKSFNGPQLAAIQWAATHTAAGTSNGLAKKQDPWPFTLVQGPPGTGKTHTVWGMLNVIHLVQYQHYYAALLKKLAPDSYTQPNENTDSVVSGSIDEVLRNMDQNLFRTLPKLCPKPRMLVCAPSNAATDELLARALDRGFIDGEMRVYRPDVARVGVDTQSRAAQAVSVERRTEQLLVKNREEVYGWLQQLKVRENHLSQEIASLQRQLVVSAAAGRSLGSVGVDPDVLMARDQNRDSLLQKLAAAVEGRDKVLVEMSRLLIIEGRFRPGSGFNLEEARASLEASFANEAEIVFTTLSSSGRKLFSSLTHGFDMIVIDEAAQASEMAVLPALCLGAARCVLVGDPQQLPATVISKAAGILQYSRSLFERLQQAGCPSMMLSVQFRMHPQIRDFPSRHFYQGRLTDSESIINSPDEKYYLDPLLRPYIFFDISHGRESHKGGSVSYQNVHEAQFCLRIYEHLQKTVKSLGLGKVSVGIITPYKLQLRCLQREFEQVLKSEEGKDLYINTVDAFQGQERDVIIMSCVRASGHGVGFVADIRRMNVALTRARRALWVMGNANALVQSSDWAALVDDAKDRKCYMNMDSIPKEFQMPKAPSYPPFPVMASHGARGASHGARGRLSGGPGPRPRAYNVPLEFNPGSSSERPFVGGNSNHRSMRPHFEHFGDRSRDSRPMGDPRWQNSAGPAGRR